MKKIYWKDVAERVVWTFLQAFIGAYAITGMAGGRKAAESAAIAGVAAVLSFLKGFIAQKIGNPDSASTVPSV